MSYPYLRTGDVLPAVGVLQKLLNSTGASLSPDGIYGRNTRRAVMDFQRARAGMGADGIVGRNTWPRLSGNADLPVIDCIDVWDPDLHSMEVNDIRRAGGNPVVIGGMCNGVEQAVQEILGRARNVFLLRFHGHGAPGAASIATGHGELDPDMRERSDIALDNLSEIRPIVRRLRSVFGPYGCVQFMHCETAGGRSGRRLMDAIAADLGVPVTAAIRTQFGGGIATFRFEGPTYTAIPVGGSLRDWCRGRPDFVGFSPR